MYLLVVVGFFIPSIAGAFLQNLNGAAAFKSGSITSFGGNDVYLYRKVCGSTNRWMIAVGTPNLCNKSPWADATNAGAFPPSSGWMQTFVVGASSFADDFTFRCRLLPLLFAPLDFFLKKEMLTPPYLRCK